MSIDPSLIKVDKIILQPFKKNAFTLARGGIDKLYMRMYQLAESLAIHEMKKYDSLLNFKRLYSKVMLKGEIQDHIEIDEEAHKYRDERIQHHMNEMKEILFGYLEIEKIKTFKDIEEKMITKLQKVEDKKD